MFIWFRVNLCTILVHSVDGFMWKGLSFSYFHFVAPKCTSCVIPLILAIELQKISPRQLGPLCGSSSTFSTLSQRWLNQARF